MRWVWEEETQMNADKKISVYPWWKIFLGVLLLVTLTAHAQNPPKLKASYAHAAPIRIPVPKAMIPKNVHGNAGLDHSRTFPVMSPPTANANGMSVEAKPRNNTGG